MLILLALPACCGCIIAMKSAHLHVKERVIGAYDQSFTTLLYPSCLFCVWPCEVGIIQCFSSIVRNFFSGPQRQRLIRARVSPEEGGAAGEESSGTDRTMGEGDLQPQEEERGKEVAGVMGGGAQHKEEAEDEEGEDEDAPFKPFVLPGEWRKKKKGLLCTVERKR